jgi:hypothetical protein
MSIFGSKQRLCYSVWIIAALILMTTNGVKFLALEDYALEGYSPVIKSLQLKLTQMENALTVQNAIDSTRNEIQHFFTAYRLQPSPDEKVDPTTVDNQRTQIGETEPELPELKGIIKITDESGNIQHAALIGGRLCRPKDNIMNFKVVKIFPNGVVLSRSKKRWFIPSPNVYYSDDYGK